MKKLVSIFMVLSIMVMGFAGCSGQTLSVEEDVPCAYCDESPAKGYKTRSGDKFYVCEDCSSTCMLCGESDSTKHYENALGAIVFVCDDCYNAVKALSE